MNDHQYRVSVIVPVYNTEKYLRRCINSLITQTIAENEFEILLIDDGSTDSSGTVCDEYAELYPFITAFHRENGGPGAARNTGIKNVQGKYITFLDADDTFSPGVLLALTNYFDEVYEKVDAVAFNYQPYTGAKKGKLAWKYEKQLIKTGIYDIDEKPYALPNRLSVFVKNKRDDTILFDETPGLLFEDLDYICRLVKDNHIIGYCAEVEYRFQSENEAALRKVYYNSIKLWEPCLILFEQLFAFYDNAPPKAIQANFIDTSNWKMRQNALWPYHYGQEAFAEAQQRFIKLLNMVDNEVILNHPAVDHFHKHYWIAMKTNNVSALLTRATPPAFELLYNGTKNLASDRFEIIVRRIRVEQGTLIFIAMVKSVLYNYLTEESTVYAIENGETRKKLDVWDSFESSYRTRTHTNNFYAFQYECSVNSVSDFSFEVELDGISFPVTYSFTPESVFSPGNSRMAYIRSNTLISFADNHFQLKNLNKEEITAFHIQETAKYIKTPDIFRLRTLAAQKRKQQRIWLYFDMFTVTKDSGYYQFIHDLPFSETDGILRYYVADKNNLESDILLPELKDNIVAFGSEYHKLLYLSAEKLLTAYIGLFNRVSPFTSKEEEQYSDITDYELIYLQHGILHSHYPNAYIADNCRCDKIVVSSPFEVDNFIRNYHYKKENLLPFGQPRFMNMETNAGRRKILFAPSWRSSFAPLKDSLSGQIDLFSERFLKSDYFINISTFLQSSDLHRLLEKYDFKLDFKPHPIIALAKNLFPALSPRIKIITTEITHSDYQIFVTDFSSFVFDFVYLKCAILYFVPDMDYFKCGVNQYRDLDLPFEDAFGELTLTPEDAVAALERILDNKCKPQPVFQERMDTFFLPMEDSCGKLYQYLSKGV